LITREAGPILLCSGGELDKARMGMSWLVAAHPIPIMEQRELVDGFVKATLAPLVNDLGIASAGSASTRSTTRSSSRWRCTCPTCSPPRATS
jgi:hypothetical protein